MNKIVLVIDDEESILQSMKFLLGNSGYTVMTAADATAGLKIIKELEHELSVIVTDLFLPGGFDGFDIIEAVKDLGPRTAHADTAYRRSAIRPAMTRARTT